MPVEYLIACDVQDPFSFIGEVTKFKYQSEVHDLRENSELLNAMAGFLRQDSEGFKKVLKIICKMRM